MTFSFFGTADSAQPYWNMGVEPLLNSEEIRPLQEERLVTALDKIFAGSALWREWCENHDVKNGDIRTVAHLAKALPPFRKSDFRTAAEARGFDMDRLLTDISTQPPDQLRLLAATSGTTGEPTPYPFTEADIQVFCEINARVWWRAGVRPGDRVLQAFALGMFVAGVPLVLSNMMMGACVIPVGAEAGAERILRTAKNFQATALNCTPSLAMHLIERAPEVLGEPIKSLGITRLICGGEPGAGLPEVRRRIEDAFGARLFDFGAGAGGSCDHPEYQGMHWVADDLVLYELVDPMTDEAIPLEDGAEGEAVFTSIGGTEGMLMLRQSVGDIHRVTTSPCPCGKSGLRYQIVGRTDDMLKVKGVMVYPAAISDVIASFAPKVTGEFRIVLSEPPPRVVPPLVLKVEHADGVTGEELPALGTAIVDAMRQRLRVSPAITWLPPRTLERSAHKTALIERAYQRPGAAQ